MGIENTLNSSLFSGYSDKSFVDKTLAREDNLEIKTIIEKETLERSDYAKLGHYLSSIESKLLNFTDWDRYMAGKFLCWINDFIATAGLMFDYISEVESNKIELLDESKKLLSDVQKIFSHDCKELVSTYSYITRSTLSLKAKGFDTVLTNKFEYNYLQPSFAVPQAQQPKNFFSRFMGGNQSGGNA